MNLKHGESRNVIGSKFDDFEEEEEEEGEEEEEEEEEEEDTVC